MRFGNFLNSFRYLLKRDCQIRLVRDTQHILFLLIFRFLSIWEDSWHPSFGNYPHLKSCLKTRRTEFLSKIYLLRSRSFFRIYSSLGSPKVWATSGEGILVSNAKFLEYLFVELSRGIRSKKILDLAAWTEHSPHMPWNTSVSIEHARTELSQNWSKEFLWDLSKCFYIFEVSKYTPLR